MTDQPCHPPSIRISVNPTHVSHFNPSDTKKLRAAANKAAEGYKTTLIESLNDVEAMVKTGATWINLTYKNGHRKGVNFIGADTITVEFDEVKPGIDDWETLATKSGAFCAIPSPSYHTGFRESVEVENKETGTVSTVLTIKPPGGYRLLFRLDRRVTCPEEFKKLVSKMMVKLGRAGAVTDKQCKDSARFFLVRS